MKEELASFQERARAEPMLERYVSESLGRSVLHLVKAKGAALSAYGDLSGFYPSQLKSFTDLALSCGSDPLLTLQAALLHFRGLIQEGRYYFGPLLDFKAQDLALFDALLSDIAKGRLALPASAIEDQARAATLLLDDLETVRKPPDAAPLFVETLGPLEEGRWAMIERSGFGEMADDVPYFDVKARVRPGGAIRIIIESAGHLDLDSIFLNFDDMFTDHPLQGTMNAIFNRETRLPSRRGAHVFDLRFPGAAPTEAGMVPEGRAMRRYRFPVPEPYASMAGAMISALPGKSAYDKLISLYGFVSESSSQEGVADLFDQDDPFLLLDHLARSGSFPGVCRAHASVGSLLSLALGFPVRKVEGEQYFKDEEGFYRGSGHVWAEVYAKGLGLFVPFDTAGGSLLSYDPDSIIVVGGRLPMDLVPARFKFEII